MEKKRILFIDDDPDLVAQNKLLLESKNYHVYTASSGKEGWEVYQQTKPDAVVIDLIMEEHDSGFILSYKIKKGEHGKKIPVYIVTSAAYLTGFKFGTSTEEEREWIKCDAILNKPVVLDELVQKLNEFWALHKK